VKLGIEGHPILLLFNSLLSATLTWIPCAREYMKQILSLC